MVLKDTNPIPWFYGVKESRLRAVSGSSFPDKVVHRACIRMQISVFTAHVFSCALSLFSFHLFSIFASSLSFTLFVHCTLALSPQSAVPSTLGHWLPLLILFILFLFPLLPPRIHCAASGDTCLVGSVSKARQFCLELARETWPSNIRQAPERKHLEVLF